MRFAQIPYSFALNLKASFLNPETFALNPKASVLNPKASVLYLRVSIRVKSLFKSAAHFKLLLIKESIDPPR